MPLAITRKSRSASRASAPARERGLYRRLRRRGPERAGSGVEAEMALWNRSKDKGGPGNGPDDDPPVPATESTSVSPPPDPGPPPPIDVAGPPTFAGRRISAQDVAEPLAEIIKLSEGASEIRSEADGRAVLLTTPSSTDHLNCHFCLGT